MFLSLVVWWLFNYESQASVFSHYAQKEIKSTHLQTHAIHFPDLFLCRLLEKGTNRQKTSLNGGDSALNAEKLIESSSPEIITLSDKSTAGDFTKTPSTRDSWSVQSAAEGGRISSSQWGHTHWKSYFCCHLVAEIFPPQRCPHCIIENDITVEWGHTVLGNGRERLNIKSKMFHRLSAWLMWTCAKKPGRRSLTDKDDQYCDSQHPAKGFLNVLILTWQKCVWRNE